MNPFVVTPIYLAEAYRDTTNASQHVADSLFGMRSYVMDLVGDALEEPGMGRYTGVAAGEFQVLMDNVDRESHKLNSGLQEIAEALNQLYHIYFSTESGQVGDVQTIASALPSGTVAQGSGQPIPQANL